MRLLLQTLVVAIDALAGRPVWFEGLPPPR